MMRACLVAVVGLVAFAGCSHPPRQSVGAAMTNSEAPAPADDDGGLRSGELFDALARMDSVLFDASFASCDAAKANAIFTDDVEFYHDQAGVSIGEQVRDDVRKLTASCPASRGVTRTLVPGSLRVYPIEGYGAAQAGVHRFEERGAATATLARFMHVWRLQDGRWRLARVLSLDHQSVPALASPSPSRTPKR